jgi:hypothetical protein
MDQDQIKEHLRFAAELGVAGISRDTEWRTRADSRIQIPEAPERQAPNADGEGGRSKGAVLRANESVLTWPPTLPTPWALFAS